MLDKSDESRTSWAGKSIGYLVGWSVAGLVGYPLGLSVGAWGDAQRHWWSSKWWPRERAIGRILSSWSGESICSAFVSKPNIPPTSGPWFHCTLDFGVLLRWECELAWFVRRVTWCVHWYCRRVDLPPGSWLHLKTGWRANIVHCRRYGLRKMESIRWSLSTPYDRFKMVL